MSTLARTTGFWCSCCSFIFAFFPAGSIFYLWGFHGLLTTSNLFGTGAFAVSGVRNSQLNPDFPRQINSWAAISSEKACVNNSESNFLYENWSGRYEFCDRVNGTFTVPSTVRTIQAFLILNVVFLALLTCFAGIEHPKACTITSFVPTSVHRKSACSAAFAALAAISSMISFSIIASFQWYRDLRERPRSTFIPVFNVNDTLVAFPLDRVEFVYGPSYVVQIVIFVATVGISILYLVLALSKEVEPPKYAGEYIPDDSSDAGDIETTENKERLSDQLLDPQHNNKASSALTKG